MVESNERKTMCCELSDGNWVVLLTTKPLTVDSLDDLRGYLDVYRKILEKREGASPPTE